MGYQALLFCSDEKLLKVVGQVFGDLDFTVEPVHEPFAAVKKLMAQHYDAIVVDSENEQNASLLFKSARNSTSNHSTLAIALVEGQAGVAKAYRIGANLVLTKPINVEQAKGTIRVARGLLRKTSEAAGATRTAAPTTPVSSTPMFGGSSFQPAGGNAAATASSLRRSEAPDSKTPLPAITPEGQPAETARDSFATNAQRAIADQTTVTPTAATPDLITIAPEGKVEAQPPSSAGVVDRAVESHGIKNAVQDKAGINPAASVSEPAQNAAPAFSSIAGSAAAPAPAKEAPVVIAETDDILETEHAASSRTDSLLDLAPTPVLSSVPTGHAPSFGGLSERNSGGSGVNKKTLIVAAIILALAALGYLVYGMLGKSSATAVPHIASTSPDLANPASVLRPQSSPVAAPARSTPGGGQTSPSKTATGQLTGKTTASGSLPTAEAGVDRELESKKPDSAPLRVKSEAAENKTQAQADEPAPSLSGLLAGANENANTLSGAVSSAPSSLPALSISTVKLSQGVSEGLLIKRVQPKYPQSALAAHIQGAVQIEATINNEGVVTNPKVLRGDRALAQAAVEAVRQWRYKPYYLDGQPVEVKTEITVKFRAN
ncbi:MAG: TonB family protein [Terriglobales bacterium]